MTRIFDLSVIKIEPLFFLYIIDISHIMYSLLLEATYPCNESQIQDISLLFLERESIHFL